MKPAGALNESAPEVLQHFIGQQSAVAQVQVALEAAWADGRRFPHTLLVGPSGCGKTELARVIGKEMGMASGPITAMGLNLKSPGEVTGFLMQARSDKDVLFVDECHELPKKCQTQFYGALTDRKVVESSGPFSQSPMTIILPDFTLLAATTDEHLLLGPMRNRFEITLPLTRYQVDEVAQIIQRRLQRMNWPHADGVPRMVAERSAGIPRKGMMLLKAAERHRAAVGDDTITTVHLDQAIRAQGLDSLGLDQQQQTYLRHLRDHQPMRLHELAHRLDRAPPVVQRVVEPDLFYLQLASKGGQGRHLTNAGMAHALGLEQQGVTHV